MNSWLFTRWVTLLGVTASRWGAAVPAVSVGLLTFLLLPLASPSNTSNTVIRLRYQGCLMNLYGYKKMVWHNIGCAVKRYGFLVLIPEQAIRFLMLSQGRIVHAFSWVVKKLCCYIQAYESIEALSKVIRLKFRGAEKKKKKKMVLKLLILNGKCIFVTLEFSIATLTALWKYVAAPKKQQNFNV